MKRVIPKVLQKDSLDVNFTGILIVEQYNSAVNAKILFVFEKGEIKDYKKNLYDFYNEKELDDYIVKWLEDNNYDNLEIYTDPNKIVSEFDYSFFIGEPYELKRNMACVKS